MRRMIYLAACVALLAASACDDETTAPSNGGSGGTDATGGAHTTGGTGGMLPFALTSSAFVEGGTIPQTHECGAGVGSGPGDNLSPPLSWTPGPASTQSYAVVMRDIDAGGLVHWVIYDIPPATTALPMAVPSGYQPGAVAGAKQAEIQGSGYFGYFGPCSPQSVNTYQWTVHALPSPSLAVTMQSTENEIAAAVEAASIASAALSGES